MFGSYLVTIADVKWREFRNRIVKRQIRSNDTAVLSKFGVETDLDIAKRVLSLKLKPGVNYQLHGRKLEKLKNQNDVIISPWVVLFRWNSEGRC